MSAHRSASDTAISSEASDVRGVCTRCGAHVYVLTTVDGAGGGSPHPHARWLPHGHAPSPYFSRVRLRAAEMRGCVSR